MISRPLRILFQAKEPLSSFASKIVPFGKIFTLKNLWKREDLFSSNLHTCFANIASLNFCSSLKPMLPRSFGRQSVLHFDQCIFLWFPQCPHQNLWIICSMSLHKVMMSLKQLMAKVTIACTTAFSNTSRPAWERSCSFQPCSLAHTLSLINLRLSFLFLSTRVGSPSYFSYCLNSWTPNKLVIYSMATVGVDLLIKKEVFDLFSCWLEAPS